MLLLAMFDYLACRRNLGCGDLPALFHTVELLPQHQLHKRLLQPINNYSFDSQFNDDDLPPQERDRLAAKGLSRISQSRERFLLEKGGGDGGANAQGPVANLVSGIRVFVRIQEGQPIEEVAEIVKNIEQK